MNQTKVVKSNNPKILYNDLTNWQLYRKQSLEVMVGTSSSTRYWIMVQTLHLKKKTCAPSHYSRVQDANRQGHTWKYQLPRCILPIFCSTVYLNYYVNTVKQSVYRRLTCKSDMHKLHWQVWQHCLEVCHCQTNVPW